MLRQCKSKGHGHAALDLPLAVQRIDCLTHKVRRVDLLDGAVVVEHADLGGVAVSHMAHGIFHILCTQGVCLGQVLAVELLALQLFPVHPSIFGQFGSHDAVAAVFTWQILHFCNICNACIVRCLHICTGSFQQLLAGAAAGLAGDEGLPGAGGSAGIRRIHIVGRLVDDVLPITVEHGAHDLRQHRAKALADAGRAAADVNFAALHCHDTAAGIRDANAHAGIFHGAGNAHVFILFADVLHGLQRLYQACGGRRDLPVGQGLTGTDGVAIADLPGGNTQLVGHFRQRHLHGEAGLRHAKAAERAGRRVIGIVRPTGNLKILVVIRARGVRARALEHGAAE